MPKYVLLDRDGVINRRIFDGYVLSWEQFEFLPRALEGLRLLTANDYRLIVVSNQACIGKGLMSSEALAALTVRFVEQVEKSGGRIDGVYYCPHRDQDACDCRKPKPGLLLQAQREHHFNFSETFLVGDSERDLRAAHQVGCRTILVGSAKGHSDAKPWLVRPEANVPDLAAAAEFILAQEIRNQDCKASGTKAAAVCDGTC